jgi:hypothetical protein
LTSIQFFLRGRWCCGRTGRDGLTDLEEHLLQAGRGDRNQHPGRSIRLVLEGMKRADRHVGEHSWTGHEAFVPDEDGNLAFEDVKPFFLPAVGVRGWTAALRLKPRISLDGLHALLQGKALVKHYPFAGVPHERQAELAVLHKFDAGELGLERW